LQEPSPQDVLKQTIIPTELEQVWISLNPSHHNR